jgi:mRNA-degrading endonuclease RelE of RelBE toxin-antitoxin system
VTLTKNGVPAAILIGTDEWEELQETLFWLSQPGVLEDIAASARDRETGRMADEDVVRILDTVDDDTVTVDVIRIDHRGSAYRPV